MRGVLPLLMLCTVHVASADTQRELKEAQTLLSEVGEGDARSGFTYSARYMLYYEEGDSLVLRGEATVRHKGATLKAAEMVYFRALDRVEARSGVDSSGAVVGQPVLERSEEVLRGERILYDLKDERGSILSGRIQRDKGFYSGREIQTHTSSEFHVHEGAYTTCDLPAPHFDFYSPRIKVIVDNMAIARPVYLRVAERRLFWIPFFIFSLGENRRSGMLTPGYGRRPLRYGSAQSEWEVRDLGYYIAPNDFWDATAAVDLRQRSGWLGRLQLNYALRYRFNGTVNARLENRQSGSAAQRNWRIDFNHSQQMGRDANLRASGTFQSNESFGLDNSARLNERLNRTLRSNFSYSRRFRESGNSFSLNASQTKNLDTQTHDIVLPELSFRKGRQPLWERGNPSGQQRREKAWYERIYYDGNARLRNGERGTLTDTTRATRADLGMRVTAQYQPLSWLTFNPTLDESWSDADLRSRRAEGVREDRLGTRLGVSQTLYGLFQPHWGPLVALRHVLKPALNLNYQARKRSSGGTFGIGGRNEGWQMTRRVDLRLDNTLWAKLQRGEDEDKVRIGQLNVSTAYDMEDKKRPLKDLVGSLSIEMGRYVSSRLSTRSAWYDDSGRFGLQGPRQFEVRNSIDLSARGKSTDGRDVAGKSDYEAADTFGFESGLSRDMEDRSRRRRLQLSHYYARTRSAASVTRRSWVRIGAGFGLGGHWNVDYSINYNLRAPGLALVSSDRVTSELFSLQRRFHDWTATLNIEPSRFHQTRAFYFKAQFNDIPQLKFERGDARF